MASVGVSSSPGPGHVVVVLHRELDVTDAMPFAGAQFGPVGSSVVSAMMAI